MRKAVFLGLLVILLAFSFIGCDDGENNGDTQYQNGKITFINIPQGYKLNLGMGNDSIQVSNNPTFIWQASRYGPVHPRYNQEEAAKWYPSVIGNAVSGGVVVLETNIVDIRCVKYYQDESDYYGWWFNSVNQSFNYTGSYSVYVHFQLPVEGYFSLGLNNVPFNNGQATIDVSSYISQLPNTDGLFTLNELEEHNGKYAFLVGMMGQSGPILYGIKDLNTDGSWKGFQISNNKAEIPIFSLNTGDTQFRNFNQSGKAYTIVVYITNNETINYTNVTTAFSGATAVTFLDTTNIQNINSGIQFASGKATASINDSNATVTQIP